MRKAFWNRKAKKERMIETVEEEKVKKIEKNAEDKKEKKENTKKVEAKEKKVAPKATKKTGTTTAKKEGEKKTTKKQTTKKTAVNTNRIVAEMVEKAKEAEVTIIKEKPQKVDKKKDTTAKGETKKKKEANVEKKTKKEEKKEKVVLEKIEKEAKKINEIPLEKKREMNDNVFKNIVIAITMMLYFLFINIGFVNIAKEVFITDLKVFSISLAVFAIILFEKAYKKDSGSIAISGIEVLVFAIGTLLSIGVINNWENKFQLIVASMSFLVGAYYAIKAMVGYLKEKKAYFREVSDIPEIVKK